jgi:hypothetical protein
LRYDVGSGDDKAGLTCDFMAKDYDDGCSDTHTKYRETQTLYGNRTLSRINDYVVKGYTVDDDDGTDMTMHGYTTISKQDEEEDGDEEGRTGEGMST